MAKKKKKIAELRTPEEKAARAAAMQNNAKSGVAAVPIPETTKQELIAVSMLSGLQADLIRIGEPTAMSFIIQLTLPIDGKNTKIPFTVASAMVVRELLDHNIKSAIGGFVPEAKVDPKPVEVKE